MVKKKSWKVFMKHPELFKNLGVGRLTEAPMSSAEEFICKMYSKSSDITSVKNTLDQHIRRASYQTKVWQLA